ncbi:MAG: ATP-binding cassette domain-containing protein [Planctomycetota bacterium]
MTNAAIQISSVNKRFGRTHAVRDLDLVVPTGSVCGFLGPNGAGKSTTIRMIMSIIYPDDGQIEVLGSSALANKDKIGYLPEERGVYRKMKVGSFLEYIGTLKGVEKSTLRTRIADWLERIELPHVAKQRCEELSKGMQQKVQFLAAIIHDPDLVILDEPFSGLDPVNAQLLNTLIREMHESGKTIIFSTHVLHQAEQICDRFFLINHGVKLLDATLDEIHTTFDPRTIVVEPVNGAAHFDQIPGVRSVRSSESDPRLELEIADDADPHAIMRSVMDGGPVKSIARRQLSMDEVFIRLVREGGGEEAADQAREDLSHV